MASFNASNYQGAVTTPAAGVELEFHIAYQDLASS